MEIAAWAALIAVLFGPGLFLLAFGLQWPRAAKIGLVIAWLLGLAFVIALFATH